MLNLDHSTLNAVVETACKDAARHVKWLTAIGRALVELESNPWIERGDHGLIIGSPSGETYVSNGVCQCKAYEFQIPCWHRACARLVRLHDEALERQQLPAELVRDIKAIFAAMDARESQAEDRLIAQLEQIAPSLGDRLARARREMDELFA